MGVLLITPDSSPKYFIIILEYILLPSLIMCLDSKLLSGIRDVAVQHLSSELNWMTLPYKAIQKRHWPQVCLLDPKIHVWAAVWALLRNMSLFFFSIICWRVRSWNGKEERRAQSWCCWLWGWLFYLGNSSSYDWGLMMKIREAIWLQGEIQKMQIRHSHGCQSNQTCNWSM